MSLKLPITATELSPDEQMARLICASLVLAGLSREELAGEIHCTPRQLRNYLSGKARLDWQTIQAIADATGQPLEAFRLQLKRRVS